MRNRMYVILITMLILSLILSGCTQSTKKGTEGLLFSENNGGYEVSGYVGTDLDVVIPDTYNNIPVVAVEESALADSNIRSVSFGKNIRTLNEFAFQDCDSLESIHFTDNTPVMIDEACFKGCDNLVEVDISNLSNDAKIYENAFYSCEALESIYVSGDVTIMVCSDSIWEDDYGQAARFYIESGELYSDRFKIK